MKKIESSINHSLLLCGLFFFGFGLLFLMGTNGELTIIFVSVSFIFALIAFASRKSVVTINTHDGSTLELYFNKRNKEVVDFVTLVIEASNAYLLNKFGNIDLAMPMEGQLNNIQFLRNRGVISEEAYQWLKNRLLRRTDKSSIGFGF